MISVLITAFKPYDRWDANASWLTMQELTKDLPGEVALTTRLYPVDYDEVRRLLESDLQRGYDYALHLGQAPGSSTTRLEAIGVNVATHRDKSLASGEDGWPLAPGGPVAHRSRLPLALWADRLRKGGIPAEVSYHAGTYLCNATLYLTHHLIEQRRLATQATFIHVPLDISQVIAEDRPLPALPASISAAAVRMLLNELVSRSSAT
jgi:pyroglutamyl-peptidase